MIYKNKKSGVTIIETVFYFTIISFILFAVMSFGLQLMILSMQSENIHEIRSNIDFISEKIITAIQKSDGINLGSSTLSSDSGRLTLYMSVPQKNPTEFYIQNNAVFMKEGSSAAVQISSNLINCTKLRFERVTAVKTPDQLIIEADFEPENTDITSLDQSLGFHTSISLRQL